MSKRNAGLKLLGKPVAFGSFYHLTEANRRELQTLKTEFASFEDLKQYRIDNFDIGFGVGSSLISMFKVAEPDVAANQQLIKRLIIASFSVYRSLQNYLDQQRVDLVYLYNGRFAPLRAAMRACQSRNVPFKVHEVGHSLQHYALWDNTIPHDVAYTEKKIREKWQSARQPERQQIGARFFEDRAKGKEYVYLSFVKDQQQDMLPANWDAHKKNIIIFNSSEYEFASIGDEWKNKIYGSQHEGIRSILQGLDQVEGHHVHLYLRMHPNLKGVTDTAVTDLLELRHPRLTIIPPESPISTYALLRNAGKVVTFCSTVGIEAVYWGVPSILLGMNYYYNLGGTYNPQTHEEAMTMLLEELPPKDKEAALMYGYYMNTFGIPFKYYETEQIFEGRFKGVQVKPSNWLNFALAQQNRYPKMQRPIRRISSFLLRKGV
jgi:hypothetical protein